MMEWRLICTGSNTFKYRTRLQLKLVGVQSLRKLIIPCTVFKSLIYSSEKQQQQQQQQQNNNNNNKTKQKQTTTTTKNDS